MSTKLDRSQFPPLQAIQELPLIIPAESQLDNGIQVNTFDLGQQDVLMLKLIFKGGKWFEKKRLVAGICSRMLREGTSKYSAQEIANEVEFYGSTLRSKSTSFYSFITLHTLTKHLEKILPVIQSILTESTFPEEELNTIVRNSQQSLTVNKEQIAFLADERFTTLYFGKDHPYGYELAPEDYASVTQEDLQKFYTEHYSSSNCAIYIAGKLAPNTLQVINQYLGQSDWNKGPVPKEPVSTAIEFKPGLDYIKKEGAVQAALRMGMPLFNKTHPDFMGMFVLNTILGGYFGSRLVNNIREEKGYTYGIYSTIVSFLQYGYFFIGTELRADVWEETIQEIFSEMNRLKEEPVEEMELERVRNYLMGTLLTNMDGPFNLASSLQGVASYGLKADFYHQLVEVIKTINQDQLQALAKKYFLTENMLSVVVGP